MYSMRREEHASRERILGGVGKRFQGRGVILCRVRWRSLDRGVSLGGVRKRCLGRERELARSWGEYLLWSPDLTWSGPS